MNLRKELTRIECDRFRQDCNFTPWEEKVFDTAIGTPQAVNIAAANDAASVTLPIGPRVAGHSSSIITLVATTTAGNVIIGGVSTLAWKL